MNILLDHGQYLAILIIIVVYIATFVFYNKVYKHGGSKRKFIK